jgi:protein transport protein SEC61 subunit gamma-like protein
MDIKTNTKSFIVKCGRVWKIMRKPTTEEYKVVSKVSILGLLAIGLLGFAISLVVQAIV